MSAGRPPLDRWPIVEEVAARLSKGEPLAQICRQNNMPSDQTIRDWMKDDEAISLAIARSRESGFDVIAADTLAIADDDEDDDMVKVARAKVKIETRLKLLAKWDPKRFGEVKQDPVTVNLHNHLAITEERMEELRKIKRESIARQIEVKTIDVK